MVPISEEEYNKDRSTKLDALVDIIKYHSAGQGLPQYDCSRFEGRLLPIVETEDVFTTSGHTPEHDPNQPEEKLVCYFAWPFMKVLIKRVLKWSGFSAAYIDGKTSQQNRTKILEEFNQPGPHTADDGSKTNILFISNVATTGINLPRGTIVIMLVST